MLEQLLLQGPVRRHAVTYETLLKYFMSAFVWGDLHLTSPDRSEFSFELPLLSPAANGKAQSAGVKTVSDSTTSQLPFWRDVRKKQLAAKPQKQTKKINRKQV